MSSLLHAHWKSVYFAKMPWIEKGSKIRSIVIYRNWSVYFFCKWVNTFIWGNEMRKKQMLLPRIAMTEIWITITYPRLHCQVHRIYADAKIIHCITSVILWHEDCAPQCRCEAVPQKSLQMSLKSSGKFKSRPVCLKCARNTIFEEAGERKMKWCF